MDPGFGQLADIFVRVRLRNFLGFWRFIHTGSSQSFSATRAVNAQIGILSITQLHPIYPLPDLVTYEARSLNTWNYHVHRTLRSALNCCL